MIYESEKFWENFTQKNYTDNYSELTTYSVIILHSYSES